MDGPGHYQEAEWLLDQNTVPSKRNGHRVVVSDADSQVIAVAQVHATLALAAAAALRARQPDQDNWCQVAGGAS